MRIAQSPHGTPREWYTPAALENRKAPPGDIVKVLLRWPTHGDRTAIALEHQQHAELGPDGRATMAAAAIPGIAQRLVERCVVRVENYRGSKGQIRNGAELWEYGETEITAEIVGKLFDSFAHTSDDPTPDEAATGAELSDSRTSVGQRVSRSSEIDPSRGTASSVEQPDWTSREAAPQGP